VKGRRPAVIDGAAAVFAERGFHGASTRHIADRLGLRQGSLYYYFTSKDAALEEVCRVGVEAFVHGLAPIAAGPDPAPEKLARAVANHLMPLRDRADYVRVFLFERRHLAPDHRAQVARLSQAYEALLAEIVAQGQAEGSLAPEPDPEMAVLAILGACNGAARRYRPGREPGLERLIAGLSRILADGLRARP